MYRMDVETSVILLRTNICFVFIGIDCCNRSDPNFGKYDLDSNYLFFFFFFIIIGFKGQLQCMNVKGAFNLDILGMIKKTYRSALPSILIKKSDKADIFNIKCVNIKV